MASARNGLALLFVLPDRSMCGRPEVGPQMYVLTRSFCRAQPKGRKSSTHRDARYIHTPGALGPAPRTAQAVNNRLKHPTRTRSSRILHTIPSPCTHISQPLAPSLEATQRRPPGRSADRSRCRASQAKLSGRLRSPGKRVILPRHATCGAGARSQVRRTPRPRAPRRRRTVRLHRSAARRLMPLRQTSPTLQQARPARGDGLRHGLHTFDHNPDQTLLEPGQPIALRLPPRYGPSSRKA